MKFLAVICSNNFSVPSSLLLLGAWYSVEWRAIAPSFLGSLLSAQNHHLTSQKKSNGAPGRSGVFVAALAKVEARAHNCHVVLGYCSPLLSALRSLQGGPGWGSSLKALPQSIQFMASTMRQVLPALALGQVPLPHLGLTFLTVKQIEYWRLTGSLKDL